MLLLIKKIKIEILINALFYDSYTSKLSKLMNIIIVTFILYSFRNSKIT